MIQEFKPSGTIMYGKAMIAQLASEMIHLKVEKPVIIVQPGFMRKARKVASMLNRGFVQSIRVMEDAASYEYDFLILAGGKSLTDYYAMDIRPKAIIPLNAQHLDELDEPVSDFCIIDKTLIKDDSTVKRYIERFAKSISKGLLHHYGEIDLPESFTFCSNTTVYYGNDALEKLPGLMREYSIEKPLLLTDKGIITAGLFDFILKETEGVESVVYSDIPQDSNIDTVNDISSLYEEKNCDGIIAFGGGSVLDTGKGVSLNVSLQNSDINSLIGSGHIPRLNTPLIAVPTTSGTGSEVTKVAVISDTDKGRKLLFNSNNLQPDYALLDSKLSTSLPSHLTSITGMDALTHAIEAYTCLGKNPISDYMAWTAIELIRDNLVKAVEDPKNLNFRQALVLASNLAGQAFSNSMVGMVHTIGHSVGSVCHAPHGSCMAILLPYALEFNAQMINDRLSRLLFAIAGEDIYRETPPEKRADKTISAIRELNRTLKEKTDGRHPEKFSDIYDRSGENLVNRNHFDRIARTSMGDASIVYNPVELRHDDVLQILEKSY